MRRRRFLALTAAAAAGVAGCGGGDGGGSSRAETSGAAEAEAGAFPARIAHKYGTTTVERAPKRLVIVGLRELDASLALGTVPVAVTKWLPDAIHPWARDALGEAPRPQVLGADDGVDVERVAALRPDLILAVYSDLTERNYRTLSRLAPVIAQPVDAPDFGSSWQQETLMTGAALGRPAAARRLVRRAEGQIAAAARAHPEFRGQTAAMAMDYQGTFVYGPSDVRTRFLEDLGFRFPTELADAFPNEFGGELPEERTGELDLGVLAWISQEAGGPAAIKRRAVYRDLDLRKEGRDVFLQPDDPGFYAVPFQSVLSIPTLVADIVPRLAAAADGDPSTPTDPQGR